MNQKPKQLFSLLGIFLLAGVALWIVHPKGSKISLQTIKINFQRNFKINLGLDLQGGSQLIYRAELKDIPQRDKSEALNGVRDVIERRVNSFGVSEPIVAVSGSDKIIVELPGIKDINEAIRQIGETPQLEFRTENPEKPPINPDAEGKVIIDPLSMWIPTGLSGRHLKRATVDFQQGKGLNEVVVRLDFNDEGTKLFREITEANVGKPVAIILDGQVISAPVVQTAITNGSAIISGNFTTEEAKILARRLNSGALPVPVKLLSQQNVGATLGKESIQKSALAGLLGVALIIVFMVTFYRLPGLLASLALIIYSLLTFAIFKVGISFTAVTLVSLFFFLGLTVNARFGILALLSYIVLMFLGGLQPVTLTLAGIAGFILSVGMAVDANILIFERLKEEIRAGKDMVKAVDDGFNRAWLSIRDSNVSSLITCSIIYFFGTPSIKGFAVTLAIGILVSMFTAISITRVFLKTVTASNLFTRAWLFGVSPVNAKNEKH